MCKVKHQVSEFRLEGWLLGFVVEDGYKLKGLRLATSEGECYVKLAKEARFGLNPAVQPGSWVLVFGQRKLKLKTGELKQKAYLVQPGTPPSQSLEVATPEAIQEFQALRESPQPAKAKATILVCQKSDCCKRGASEACRALEAALSDRGLAGEVKIKGTGCLKNCKAGPNIVVNKTRYSRVDASEIPDIIDKHFSCETISEPLTAPRLECEAGSIHQ